MGIRAEIENMFDKIESYGGNFGDPIATEFSFDPLTVLRDPNSDGWQKLGASIGLLVDFNVAADNSTYQDAFQSRAYRDIELALEQGLCRGFPLIVQSMLAARISEPVFYEALQQVYVSHIENWRHHGQNA